MKSNRTIIVILFCLFASSASSQLGQWSFTSQGLPMYQYTGSLPFEAVDEQGNDSRLPEDPYFFTGNYRLALFTHVSGIFQFITAERAWARINFEEKQPNYGNNDACLTMKTGGQVKKTNLVGIHSIASDPLRTKRYFGIGFARYEYKLDNNLSCTRVISVKPSQKVNMGTPSFLISVTLRNNGKKQQDIDYMESMPINYVTMGIQMKAKDKRPLSYPAVITVGENKRTALARISVIANEYLMLPLKHQRYPHEVAPPTVFMHTDSKGKNISLRIDSRDNVLASTFDTSLKPGESKTFYITIGLQDEKHYSNLENQIADFMSGADVNDDLEGVFVKLWKDKLPDFSTEKNEVLRRELLWNAHFLEASAKYSEYFNETFVPQGSVYSYHYGDNVANRDHLQAALPACYTNPELAKSCLRYVMKQSESDGEIKRGNLGFGYTPPIIYKESDQQLYMFNTLAEYLHITKDYAFLNEEVELYPAENGQKEQVLNLLKKYFVYLRDEIGVGPTGLIMLHNSDWADSFLHQYSPNKYSWSAESHLNSAMALAVLPKLINVLRESGRADVRQFIDAIENYRLALESAYMKDLGDRKFSARAYLDRKLRFGLDNICIEPQSFLLQIPTLPAERKREIYAYIKSRISDPENIGIRTRERPLWDGKPEGEDGGIWYSLEYPLLLGVATFDKKEAESLLYKFSFDNYAKHFPQYWIGQWTAPDEINSSLYREGLYAFWIPIGNFRHGLQGYCSHPHTWPLYCYYKLKDR